MRLLSFLTEVERAIVANAPVDHPGWQAARIVNFQQGMARLSMTLAGGSCGPALDGAIFLQGFALADGSLCLKASLTWRGSETFPAIAIYTTPSTDWKLEASRVADAWLQGPPILASNAGIPDQENRLVAEAS